jgi:Fe-S-cluster containining protein
MDGKATEGVTALGHYQTLLGQVDQACRRIRERYAAHIACRKGCAGNCCRIHLSVSPIEAAVLSRALTRLPRKKADHIRRKASSTTTFGPCPLLEEGACLMYASRLIICRTHGLPMATEYRGHRSVGCCQENFRRLAPIPADALMDLDGLNRALAEVNRTFVAECAGRLAPGRRYSVAEALLLDPGKNGPGC